jgi:Glycosyl hydrolases family 2, sugar binding domain/Glycosyl hydrolases family 2/Glycosyl hydrolases family 2, TIM barrel domain
MTIKNYLATLFLLVVTALHSQNLSLSGAWEYQLDSANVGLTYNWQNYSYPYKTNLPGFLRIRQEPMKELLASKSGEPSSIPPTWAIPNGYTGTVWYRKEVEIPSYWRFRSILLQFERVFCTTHLWIDGKLVGTSESLSTPHVYELSPFVTGGKHIITLRISNAMPYDLGSLNDAGFGSMYQGWNGLVAKPEIVVKDKVYIENIQVFPEPDSQWVRITANVKNGSGSKVAGEVLFSIGSKQQRFSDKTLKINLKEGDNPITMRCPTDKKPILWDEFSPYLYTLNVGFRSQKRTDDAMVHFGIRHWTRDNAQLQLNGRRILLRGTVEDAATPQRNGGICAPLDKAAWQEKFKIARSYGLNHIRFRAWCPPKMAFEVADEMGFYLQVELPVSCLDVAKNNKSARFLREEAERILTEYGNHPSFCFFSLGNELEGNFNILNNWVKAMKETDKRHFYTTTSFSLSAGKGQFPEPADDFFVSQYTQKGWLRARELFENKVPEFKNDYTFFSDDLPIPFLTHEVGQYAIFPDFKEIEKYQNGYDPIHLKAIETALNHQKLNGFAESFAQASGKFAFTLYKEEIERALRTNRLSGFQLGGLHDVPGHTAGMVGILDAFWESKGIALPEQWRQFCAPIVPLLRYDKAVYENNEKFNGVVQIANFSGNTLEKKRILWSIHETVTGEKLAAGIIKADKIEVDNQEILGRIEADLSNIKVATLVNVDVEIENTVYRNRWQIWVYPTMVPLNGADILITASFEDALKGLSEGKNVLLSPLPETIRGLENKFVPMMSNPLHFPDQDGNLGLLCDPKHPVFAAFPTEAHADWHWWDLCHRSRTLVLDDLRLNEPSDVTLEPLIRIIDNCFKNRSLATMIEVKVGKGKLLFSSMDLLTDFEKRPVARQLFHSVLLYMNSADFHPQMEWRTEQIRALQRS